MKETIDKRVCDQCKEEQFASGGGYMGGHPFHGWITVDRVNAVLMSTREDDYPHDFCSAECEAKYAIKQIFNDSKFIDEFFDKISAKEAPKVDKRGRKKIKVK